MLEDIVKQAEPQLKTQANLSMTPHHSFNYTINRGGCNEHLSYKGISII